MISLSRLTPSQMSNMFSRLSAEFKSCQTSGFGFFPFLVLQNKASGMMNRIPLITTKKRPYRVVSDKKKAQSAFSITVKELCKSHSTNGLLFSIKQTSRKEEKKNLNVKVTNFFFSLVMETNSCESN